MKENYSVLMQDTRDKHVKKTIVSERLSWCHNNRCRQLSVYKVSLSESSCMAVSLELLGINSAHANHTKENQVY